MKRIEITKPLDKVRKYQLRCALVLTAVPILCAAILSAILLVFAHLNLYFLETGGLIVSEAIQRAYFDQVIMELEDVVWMVGLLFASTFAISLVVMNWATSPFIMGERMLREAMKNPEKAGKVNDWLSENPDFDRCLAGLARCLTDRNYPFDQIPEARYQFNFRFFLKFLISFTIISILTVYVMTIVFNAIYLKVISLGINLVHMKQFGHYFVAQEAVLRMAAYFLTALSVIVYYCIGYYITRYLSNMAFVFTRAVRDHHFPLRLRHSDIYHSLAGAITEVAKAAGLQSRI
ncbi:MAG TPA: hypothetical protein VIH99_02355 [Bdellovibrionota bacterium]|jgi:hypothetical protein